MSHKITRWVRVGNNLETREQVADLVKELKNVKCQCKLVIGRTKAPKKVGSLKDISTFGSFEFTVTDDYSGGLVCRSLAGLGKALCKTKVHIEALSSC